MQNIDISDARSSRLINIEAHQHRLASVLHAGPKAPPLHLLHFLHHQRTELFIIEGCVQKWPLYHAI